MSNERIIPIHLEGDSDSENRNESSDLRRERTIPIEMETSGGSFISNYDSIPSSDALSRHITTLNVNSDSNDTTNEEFHNNRNILSYSQAVSNASTDNKPQSYSQCVKKRLLQDNSLEAKRHSSDRETITKPKYNIKPLSEVRTEQHLFYEQYRNFKGRINTIEDVEARFGKKSASERIVFVIDLGSDDKTTPFIYNNRPMSALNSIKRIIYKYVSIKVHNSSNEFALIVLEQNSVILYEKFTKNVEVLQETVSQLSECRVEDIFDLNPLLDLLRQIVDQKPSENPEYITHVVLFYNRSFTIPEYDCETYTELLSNPNLIVDIVMTHEPVGTENNVIQITEIFKNMISSGENNMIFPVGRNSEWLRSAFYKIVGHPHRRLWQIRH